MSQISIHRVVDSVINLIEQTQDASVAFVPQTAKLTLTQPFRTANNTFQQTQVYSEDDIHTWGTILQAEQNTCIETALEHTWTSI